MSPLLCKVTTTVNRVVKAHAIVRTEAGKYDELMCWYQDIDEVQLQQAQFADNSLNMSGVD